MQLNKIESIKPSRYTGKVCNIEVENDNSYVTSGFVVHNCEPSASFDIMFNREILNEMNSPEPKRESAGFKIYHEFNPGHRYGSGHDVGGGVGLDSSTSVFWDFDTIPNRVVATFKSNQIEPMTFGDEIYRELDFYSQPLCAVESNNHGHATLGRLRQLGAKLFKKAGKSTKIHKQAPTEYGWNTNPTTKPKMLYDLIRAVDTGQAVLTDPDLIREAKSYARDDMMDKDIDPRLSTRHFDLLMAAAIGYQMKDYARHEIKKTWNQTTKKQTNIAM